MPYEELITNLQPEHAWFVFGEQYTPLPVQNSPLDSNPFENRYEWRDQYLEEHDPLRHFRESLRRINGVETVLFSYEATPAGKNIVHFYTIINADDKDLRRRIYSAEMELMKVFPKERYSFDFHLVARRGRPVSDLLKSPGCQILF